MKRTTRAPSVVLAGALVLCVPLVARGQTSPATPGFNLFSVEQDVEIGRQSAVQAERQLPMLKNRNVDALPQPGRQQAGGESSGRALSLRDQGR